MEHQDWIDRYKGLLIILVVMGHVVGGGYHLTTGAAQQLLHYTYIIIYSFHMPAFFFLAGITWHQKPDERFGVFFMKKVKRLLVPYFVFGILSSVVFCLLSGSFGSSVEQSSTTAYYEGLYHSSFVTCLLGLLHGGGLASGEGFRMNSVLWFLPCLFSVEMVYWWLQRWRLTGMRILPIVILCCVGAICFPRYFQGLPWGGTLLPWYLLFMICGAECFPLRPLAWHGFMRWYGKMGMAGIVAIYMMVCCLLPDPIQSLRIWFWWPVYALLAVVGCMLSAWIAQAFSGAWLTLCGSASMGIMLLHKFLVVFLELKVPWVREMQGRGCIGGIGTTVLLVGGVTLLCLCVTVLIKRVCPWVLGER